MGPLVDVEISAYAVTRAVQIVQSFAPHILACQDVDLRATCTTGELTEFYLDMTFEHEGVDLLLFLRQWSEGNGTSDIRRAVEILRTTVEQQHAFGLQGDIRLWRSLIVHDGSMSAVSGDGIERDVTIERLLSPETRQFLVDGNLCQF